MNGPSCVPVAVDRARKGPPQRGDHRADALGARRVIGAEVLVLGQIGRRDGVRDAQVAAVEALLDQPPEDVLGLSHAILLSTSQY
jgi:hypothetical protein